MTGRSWELLTIEEMERGELDAGELMRLVIQRRAERDKQQPDPVMH